MVEWYWTCLENNIFKFWLHSVKNQLKIFNQIIQEMEKIETFSFLRFNELQLFTIKLANWETLKLLSQK